MIHHDMTYALVAYHQRRAMERADAYRVRQHARHRSRGPGHRRPGDRPRRWRLALPRLRRWRVGEVV